MAIRHSRQVTAFAENDHCEPCGAPQSAPFFVNQWTRPLSGTVRDFNDS